MACGLVSLFWSLTDVSYGMCGVVVMLQSWSIKYLMASDPTVYVDLSDDNDVAEMIGDFREASAQASSSATPRLQVQIPCFLHRHLSIRIS
jgi:hypothetical protein